MKAQTPSNIRAFMALDTLLVACLFFMYAASPPPAINESHYMTKAKHFWDPQFCPQDVFLNSADAHWFFFFTFGVPTLFFSLPAATWIGRAVCWFCLAFGWSRLMHSVVSFRLAGTLAAPLFLAASHWGQLSGEWVIGGCEAKCMAYAFSFVALSDLIRVRYLHAALHFSIACAFHIVTGGWIIIAAIAAFFLRGCASHQRRQQLQCALVDVFRPKNRPQWHSLQLAGIMLASAAFLLIGLLPVLRLNASVDPSVADKSAIIYVFSRLPHHLTFRGFSKNRIFAHGVLIAATIAVALITFYLNRMRHRSTATANHDASSGVDRRFTIRLENRIELNDWSIALWTCAMGPLLVVVGWLIDVSLSGWATNWAANLLRYYWFRWNDVAWPIAICILAIVALDRLTQHKFASLKAIGIGILLCGGLFLPGGFLVAQSYMAAQERQLPPADEASLIFVNKPRAEQLSTYDDWRDVCDWIVQETPHDSVWLTPRNQQTFKWYAQRAEVVSWKDSPQNAADLIEWFDRIHTVFAKNELGGPVELSISRLASLGSKYRFDYILLDRRTDPKPLPLRIVYENTSYAVFEMINIPE